MLASPGQSQSSATSHDSELAALLDDDLARDVDDSEESGGATEQPGASAPLTSERSFEFPLLPAGGSVSLLLKDQQPNENSKRAGNEPPSKRLRSSTAKASAGDPHASSSGGCPPHPGFMAGLCIRCGTPKGESDERGTKLKHLHSRQHLEVSAVEAERVRAAGLAQLLDQRKLVLILDLDHTLLNSAKAFDVTEQQHAQLQNVLESERDRPHKLLYHLKDKHLWTKLRPFIFDFLQQARELFELHIYTMGDRFYAREIQQILDPTGTLFQGRVISQSDSTSSCMKDLDVVLSSEQHVLIVDDTEHVWPKHKDNLIQVDRYHYFPPQAVAAAAGASAALLPRGEDESAERGTLSVVLRVLQDVHARFWEDSSLPPARRDVRYHLRCVREQALQGCVLVFSRCWPQSLPRPWEHVLWRTAEALGAEVRTSFDAAHTTHVVAAAVGTEKVRSALAAGTCVVTPDWLQHCRFRWERADESAHLLVQPADLQHQGARTAHDSTHASALAELRAVLSTGRAEHTEGGCARTLET